jgi:hypothetical protein
LIFDRSNKVYDIDKIFKYPMVGTWWIDQWRQIWEMAWNLYDFSNPVFEVGTF